ncbi:MAG: hypothetical protein EXR98_10865 [Gemmataceae bacterium]|nr:hypothetical protein [Gemmataceae bacterium]
MVGEMGNAIMFVCSLVACGLCTVLYSLFLSHYFLVTIIDSSAGHPEVHFPRETFTDWWWKPLYCLWILIFWLITSSIFSIPLALAGPMYFVVGLAVILWFMYPLSVLSTLYTQNWFFLIHPTILWRMVKHGPALAYVFLVTFAAGALCVGLVYGMFGNFWLMLPAALIIPGAFLFYARNWGRFAWVSLNFAPQRKKKPGEKVEPSAEVDDPRNWTADEPPTLEVQEVDDPPPPPESADDSDPWRTDKQPYALDAAPGIPLFEESAIESVTTPPIDAKPQPIVEEEDEWATDKKPYAVTDEPAPAVAHSTTAQTTAQSNADKPVVVSQHYDERARKEKAEKKKAQQEAETRFLPEPSKKTPTFQSVFLSGVWGFMCSELTVGVWANLVVLTFLELFCVYLMVSFWPRLN